MTKQTPLDVAKLAVAKLHGENIPSLGITTAFTSTESPAYAIHIWAEPVALVRYTRWGWQWIRADFTTPSLHGKAYIPDLRTCLKNILTDHRQIVAETGAEVARAMFRTNTSHNLDFVSQSQHDLARYLDRLRDIDTILAALEQPPGPDDEYRPEENHDPERDPATSGSLDDDETPF